MSQPPAIAAGSAKTVPPIDSSGSRQESRLWRGLSWLVGWAWRILAGTVLCFNLPYISYLTSILVVGWINRWVRARTLEAWRKQSPTRTGDAGGRTGMPMLPPRWVLPEPGRKAPALWLNFREGLATLFCIYLVLGWGCLLMLFSWELGWLNSSIKGYEQAWIGPTVGLLGSLLFILGLIYLPLARIHMAVTGEIRSFFDVRLIWRLIRARLLSFNVLMAMILLAGVVLQILKTAPMWMYNNPVWETATDERLLQLYRSYLSKTALVLFLALLVTSALAARLYRSAVITALRDGWLVPEDLPPRLVEVLQRLDLIPAPAQRRRGLVQVLRWTWNWYSRRFLFALLFLLTFGFVATVYAGEFFNAHPFVGFMNHPLLQFPCVEYIPQPLLKP